MNSANWQFFQAFLRAPRVVASMVPSSQFLERRVVASARLDRAGAVVELGAGTGGTTRALLESLGGHGRLLAIERTEDFVPVLQSIGDPRLTVVHGCASRICEELTAHGLDGADAVISGIPFSSLAPELARRIASEVHDALLPGGRFVAYQFTDRVADYATPVFGAPRVEHEFRNLPPVRVYTWERRG
ncbi:MAG: class I SAM-dependent methyltransferase [Pseudomonadota bacterium]